MQTRTSSTAAGAVLIAAFLLAGISSAPAAGFNAPGPAMSERTDIILVQRRTCRSARSCREAVIMWCGGYSRADGDGDGIPCENVCGSRAEVNAIRREIGC